MSSTFRKTLSLLIFGCCLALPWQVSADIVYPARLELTETSPGIYQVYFVLPVIQGQVLKASPRFPEFCTAVTEVRISGNSFVKELRWTMSTGGQALYGHPLGIDGLIGTQTDIILQVRNLNGRLYDQRLSPTQPFYTLPYPPSVFQMGVGAVLQGLKFPVSLGLLYLLFLTGLFPPIRDGGKNLVLILGAGALTGTLLTISEWLRTPQWLFPIAFLLLTLHLSVGLAAKQSKSGSNVLRKGLIFIAGIFMGAQMEFIPEFAGLTASENIFYKLWTLIGIFGGILLVWALINQAYHLLSLIISNPEKITGHFGILFGSLALGLLILHGSVLWEVPSLLPSIPVLCWYLAFGILLYIGLSRQKSTVVLLLCILAVISGLVFGYQNMLPELFFPLALVSASGLILIAHPAISSPSYTGPVLIITVGFLWGAYFSDHTAEYLSYPIARMVEFTLITLFLILLGIKGVSRVQERTLNTFRINPGISLAFVCLSIIVIILSGSKAPVTFSTTSPSLQLPVLSIVLLVLVLFSWPRTKKIHRAMGISKSLSSTWVFALVATVSLLPVSIAVSNPWYSGQQPDRERMKAIVEEILSSTYTAFNLEDEEELFEVLSENVDDELLDNVYLDSRRRLTMGLREGAEVTVKQVAIDTLGMPSSDQLAEEYTYPLTWTVTARVKHLKHIHYRKNQYTGIIELKPLNEKWKISKIILNSENREVIASPTL